jgi:transcriptional repressor NrdR
MVVKRDGRREGFSRDKLLTGISKACQKLPISQLTIEKLADRVYDSITEKFTGEVPGMAIGEAVMQGLREIDQVAYVRYASVYWRFEDVDDFVQAVKRLETKHDSATYRLPGF